MDTIILALVVAIAVLLGFKKMRGTNSGTPSDDTQTEPVAVRRVLSIEGTKPFTGPVSFVKSFGISPSQLQDLRFFHADQAALDTLPEKVRECVSAAYSRGTSRGVEVPALVANGRALSKEEALYFALAGNGNDCTVFAFVDRMRSN